MLKKILINATQREELRIALVEGQKLYDLDIETKGKKQKKANVYKGVITRIEPSLEAAFVDYGSTRHGFLPFREIALEYLKVNNPGEINKETIRNSLFEGQEIIVQIDKEERGTKGAALTTFISLAGSYLVLMPNNPRAGGISRRIDGDERADLRESLSHIHIPDGMGLIIRTAGVGRNVEELEWDKNVLLSQWKSIKDAASQKHAPFLIYQEGDAVVRAIRDYLKPDITEIIIDDKDVYDNVFHYIKMIRPDSLHKVKFYKHKTPLFTRYQVENQIASVFKREVQLPSGGAIVIDHTEALISIDINSARATKGGDIEETALQTNLEATDEIARQLRLRDIGGLIVIDYIDMNIPRNQKAVENQLRLAVSLDRARIQIGRISRFGLLEMSRQRLRPTLSESNQIICPRCDGHGNIHCIETLAVIVFRVIEEEAVKKSVVQVQVEVPNELAAYLINEKRETISNVEARHGNIKIIILPNPNLQTPAYRVKGIKVEEATHINFDEPSFNFITKQNDKNIMSQKQTENSYNEPEEIPAVKIVIPDTPAPTPSKESSKYTKSFPKKGIISKLLNSIFGTKKEKTTKNKLIKKPETTKFKKHKHGGKHSYSKQSSSKHSAGLKQSSNLKQLASKHSKGKSLKSNYGANNNQQQYAENKKTKQHSKQQYSKQQFERTHESSQSQAKIHHSNVNDNFVGSVALNKHIDKKYNEPHRFVIDDSFDQNVHHERHNHYDNHKQYDQNMHNSHNQQYHRHHENQQQQHRHHEPQQKHHENQKQQHRHHEQQLKHHENQQPQHRHHEQQQKHHENQQQHRHHEQQLKHHENQQQHRHHEQQQKHHENQQQHKHHEQQSKHHENQQPQHRHHEPQLKHHENQQPQQRHHENQKPQHRHHEPQQRHHENQKPQHRHHEPQPKHHKQHLKQDEQHNTHIQSHTYDLQENHSHDSKNKDSINIDTTTNQINLLHINEKYSDEQKTKKHQANKQIQISVQLQENKMPQENVPQQENKQQPQQQQENTQQKENNQQQENKEQHHHHNDETNQKALIINHEHNHLMINEPAKKAPMNDLNSFSNKQNQQKNHHKQVNAAKKEIHKKSHQKFTFEEYEPSVQQEAQTNTQAQSNKKDHKHHKYDHFDPHNRQGSYHNNEKQKNMHHKHKQAQKNYISESSDDDDDDPIEINLG